MLRLSPEQTQAIAVAQTQTAFDQLAAHCRTYYPSAVSHLTHTALLAHLHTCHSRAQSYGLTSRRDLYRFVNLALSFGWEFDRDANLPWVRQYLNDTRLNSSAQRLELLVKYAIHRLEIEESNRALRQQFAPALTEQNPYTGDHEPETFAPIESNLLFPNPCWVNSDAEDYDETGAAEELNLNGPSLLFNRHAR